MIPEFVRRLVRPSWERVHWEGVWRAADRPYWLVDEERPAIAAASRDGFFPEGAAVLDIGCGLGGNAAWLAGRGHEVLATDISPSACRRAARRHAGVAGVSFAVVDACGPDVLRRTFPVILDSGCFHIIPLDLRPRYVRNLLAWSTPGTRFLLRMAEEIYALPEARALVDLHFVPRFEVSAVDEFPRTDSPGETKKSIAFRLIRRS